VSEANIGGDITNAVMGTAFKFVGRAIGKRVQKTIKERVVPAMQAKAAQAQQQWQQSRTDQAAIVAKYPDLRGCMHDQVVFLEGASHVVPISEIQMPVTLAGADALVDRLRAP
jgi:membrane protease subunit (stomatin/prohibitin family)